VKGDVMTNFASTTALLGQDRAAPTMLAEVVLLDGVQAAVNYGLNKVRFPAAVRVESRLRGHVTLVSAAPRGEAIEVVFGLSVEIDSGSRPACVAEVVVLYS
jgi:acyl dehydratase